MEYRGIEYSLAQGIEVGTWKWTSSLDQKTRPMSAISRQEAIKAVQGLIDKALAPKKRYFKPGRRY
jgi:hypothetical protein